MLQFSDLKIGMNVKLSLGTQIYTVDGVGADWFVIRKEGTAPFVVKHPLRWQICKPRHKRYYLAFQDSVYDCMVRLYRDKDNRDKDANLFKSSIISIGELEFEEGQGLNV